MHAVAERDTIGDKYVLTKDTIVANDGLWGDMAKMPDAGVFANLGASINERGGVVQGWFVL